MVEGFGVFLATTGFVVLLVLLARRSTPRGDLTEAWHRHEARDGRRQGFDRWMASAIYDPDWQWHWEACDRQLESVRVVAMERLRATFTRSDCPVRDQDRRSALDERRQIL